RYHRRFAGLSRTCNSLCEPVPPGRFDRGDAGSFAKSACGGARRALVGKSCASYPCGSNAFSAHSRTCHAVGHCAHRANASGAEDARMKTRSWLAIAGVSAVIGCGESAPSNGGAIAVESTPEPILAEMSDAQLTSNFGWKTMHMNGALATGTRPVLII